MKNLLKLLSFATLVVILASCSSGKVVTKPEEREQKSAIEQLRYSKFTNPSGPTVDSNLTQSNPQVIVGNLDRQFIDERKIEKPKSILTRQFVSIESILELTIGQTYGNIVNQLGNPYNILHLDNKGLIITYLYKRIHSIYDENTENMITSKAKGKIFDATLNRVYLHFDSSNKLILLVTDEGFNTSKSVVSFGQNINKMDDK